MQTIGVDLAKNVFELAIGDRSCKINVPPQRVDVSDWLLGTRINPSWPGALLH